MTREYFNLAGLLISLATSSSFAQAQSLQLQQQGAPARTGGTPSFGAEPRSLRAKLELSCGSDSYVLDTGSGQGSCSRSVAPDGTVSGTCRDDNGNVTQASCTSGCLTSNGSASCTNG